MLLVFACWACLVPLICVLSFVRRKCFPMLFVSIPHTQQYMCKKIKIDPRGSKATLLIRLFLISQHFGTTNQQDILLLKSTKANLIRHKFFLGFPSFYYEKTRFHSIILLQTLKLWSLGEFLILWIEEGIYVNFHQEVTILFYDCVHYYHPCIEQHFMFEKQRSSLGWMNRYRRKWLFPLF